MGIASPPSPEPSHDQDQWLTLSLSIIPHPQPAEPQLQLLPLLETQLEAELQPPQQQEQEPHHQESYPLAPSLFETHRLEPQLQPQQQLLPLLETEAQAPPPQEQEPTHHQESYTMAPPLLLPRHAPPLIHNLPVMLPMCALNFPSQQDQDQDQDPDSQSQTRQLARKRKPLSPGETESIEPPFPWAMTSHATVHSLDHLLAHNIRRISGMVKCKKCQAQSEIEFDLEEKFREVAGYFLKNNSRMHDRAPDEWMDPKLPNCKQCGGKECVKPLMSEKNEESSINWLFLFLGQMVGCCTLPHLKYFCKHNLILSTAAKNRLVYLTYLGLFMQLQPQVPFNNL